MEENNSVRKPTETISVVGFILSFIMPLIGLILSIIGLHKSKKNNSNQGLSIAGLIISIIVLLFRLLLIGGAVLAFMFATNEDNFNDKLDKMCAKVESCEYSYGDYYNCTYKEGIVNFSVTCKKDQIPNKNIEKHHKEETSEYTLEEFEKLAGAYYTKYYDGILETAEAKYTLDNKIEITINSGLIITVDSKTLIGKDSHGYYVDLNEFITSEL